MLPAPVPGPEFGGVLVGGETGVGAGQQLQAQGEHASPETHAGHAQPQPPPPPPCTGFICTQRPLAGHGSVKHAMPSSTHPQVSAVSAAHDLGSVCAAQESAAGGGDGGVGQSHGAHAVFGGHAGQAQVGGELPVAVPLLAVPLLALPLPVTPAPTPACSHAHSQGGQV